MGKETELLSSYVNDVLYHPERAKLDLTLLNEEYRALGESVQRLGEWAMDANQLAGAVAKGRLDETAAPTEENVLAANIQTIQRSLRRMAEEIEAIIGRSGQTARETGMVQQSFDIMVEELRKRTTALENERNLFVRFTESASERIIVLDEETGEMVFANRVAREFHEKSRDYIDGAESINQKSGCTFQNPCSEWTHTVAHPNPGGEPTVEYYHVHSIYILWENRSAIAHMFSNITEMQVMQELAMKDSLTGAFSRTYAMRYLEQAYAAGESFSLAFVDVDYLKYCNDTFGHAEGDRYLRQVVALLKKTEEQAVICRTGGDEFMVISGRLDSGQMARRMETLRRELCLEFFKGANKVHKSFSYGIAAHKKGSTETLQRLLSDADERMYQNKLENKRENHMSFKDDRLR